MLLSSLELGDGVGVQYRCSVSIGPLYFIEHGRILGVIFFDAGLGFIANMVGSWT